MSLNTPSCQKSSPCMFSHVITKCFPSSEASRCPPRCSFKWQNRWKSLGARPGCKKGIPAKVLQEGGSFLGYIWSTLQSLRRNLYQRLVNFSRDQFFLPEKSNNCADIYARPFGGYLWPNCWWGVAETLHSGQSHVLEILHTTHFSITNETLKTLIFDWPSY